MKRAIAAGILSMVPAGIWAADSAKPLDARPGLWETTMKMEMPGMPAMPAMPPIPEETLAKMPAAQRAHFEALLKARSSAAGAATKVCMTRESLSRASAFAQSQNSCTTQVVSSSPSRQEIHIECAQQKTKSSGDMVVERIDAEHVKGAMDMKTTMEGRDQAVNVKMSFDTKWVSADCGDVKPFGEK